MRDDELTGLDISDFPEDMVPIAMEAQKFLEKRNVYRAAIKEISTKLEILDDEFKVKNDYNPIHHLESRVKSVQSCFQKLIKSGFDIDVNAFDQLMDIAGVRVICKYLDDIYRIAELLTKQDDVELVLERDYILNPKESGYRSLHLVVKVPVFLSDRVENVVVEVQIRTIVMDTWASLEHELKYKSDGNISKESAIELQKCAYDMWAIDDKMQKIHKEETENIVKVKNERD